MKNYHSQGLLHDKWYLCLLPKGQAFANYRVLLYDDYNVKRILIARKRRERERERERERARERERWSCQISLKRGHTLSGLR